jgi:hypothetical protein
VALCASRRCADRIPGRAPGGLAVAAKRRIFRILRILCRLRRRGARSPEVSPLRNDVGRAAHALTDGAAGHAASYRAAPSSLCRQT